MQKTYQKAILITLVLLLINLIPISSGNLITTKINVSEAPSDDFYFIQITDTHVMHRILDSPLHYKNLLSTLIDHINSFEKKPAFIVLTGDLVAVGGGIIGALNYRTFLECFHKKDGQLYADSDYTIPVYTIPGNHDYLLHFNLINYHRFIDNKHTIKFNIMGLLENRQLNDRYTITHENLTLIFLDTGHGYLIKPSEWIHLKGSGLNYWFDIEWLDSVLVDCDTKHKIICMHHPAVNWGEYDTFGRNKDIFIQMCEGYDVDVILAGHTHISRVFDKDKNFYENNVLPLNCSQYPPLHVQTEACKEGSFYRNITISGNDVFLNPSEKP
jgi:predicted MPP superfamily phosphohydrolase